MRQEATVERLPGWRSKATPATLTRNQAHARTSSRMNPNPTTEAPDFSSPDSLRLRRDRAERILNALRAGVLCLLAAAALAYAPSLSGELNRTNILILAPALLWTVAQYLIWYRCPLLPDWISVA